MARKINVLAVDDTTANLVALEAVLGEDCNVIRATSGQQGIDVLKSRDDIDIILMDVQMPMLDGFETTKLIKQMESARAIPIVFVTAVYRDDPWVQRGYDVGGIDYFSKPFNPDILRMKVGIYANLKQKAELLKEREQQLRLSEELLETAKKLSSTFGRMEVGLIIADVHGNVREINNEVLRIFKTTRVADRESADLDMFEANRRFVCDQLAGVLGSVQSGKRPRREIVQIRCGDGSSKAIVCSVSSLRQTESASHEVALVLHDVTHAREIEDDFEQRVARLVSAAN